jgi:catechol 2,3-dioxygenase-like lactoylglutathione lyase family enzyme
VDGVVGLVHLPQQAVGHRARLDTLLLEDHGQVVVAVTFCSVDPSPHRRRSGRRCDRRNPEETNMSPTIRSLVIPVSDLDAAKALYTAMLGAPHTDQPYYVGYNVDGFEVSLAPGDEAGGPVAYADVEDLDASSRTRGAGVRARRHRRQPDRAARPVAVGVAGPPPCSARSRPRLDARRG